MPKSVFSKEYKRFLEQLRAAREKSGLTQAEVAKAMGQTQSWVSKCERGERRVDVIELLDFCVVLDQSFVGFARRLSKQSEKG